MDDGRELFWGGGGEEKDFFFSTSAPLRQKKHIFLIIKNECLLGSKYADELGDCFSDFSLDHEERNLNGSGWMSLQFFFKAKPEYFSFSLLLLLLLLHS